MPIFTTQLRKVDFSNSAEALREMANHIRYIQEQLEYTLMNLDSSNITEIETDKTDIKSSTGGTDLSGDSVKLSGGKGEMFEVGTVNNVFRFTLNGRNGEQIMYMTGDGRFVITNNATITIDSIDGGEW